MGASSKGDEDGEGSEGGSGATWEWRVDCGEIDGFEYMKAELTLRGKPVLQFSYHEDGEDGFGYDELDVSGKTLTKVWSLPDVITGVGSLDASSQYACLECLLPPTARPTRCGFDLSAASGGTEPIFTSETPLRVAYNKMADLHWCSARPATPDAVHPNAKNAAATSVKKQPPQKGWLGKLFDKLVLNCGPLAKMPDDEPEEKALEVA